MSLFVRSAIAITTFSAASVMAENEVLMNENGITLKRDAAGNLGWWTSNEDPVVLSVTPVFGQESELKTSDGLCITIDNSDVNPWPVLGPCTGELYLFEQNLIKWYNHAEICFSETEGMLSMDSGCGYKVHKVAQPVVYEQEISCEEKYVGRPDHPTCSGFQKQKLCCKYSHNCGDLHKCTSSFCCKADSSDETTTHISPATPSSTVPEAENTQAPTEITQASVEETSVEVIDVVVDSVIDNYIPEPTISPSLQEPRTCGNLSQFTRLVHCTDGEYDDSIADVVASRYTYKEMCCVVSIQLDM